MVRPVVSGARRASPARPPITYRIMPGFRYYTSTANPGHLRPSSIAEIGHNGRANHGYDTQDLMAPSSKETSPPVNFVKAQAYQDGHAGYSNPLDEQAFVVSLLNSLQEPPTWKNTAVIIMYDDSDGWYDHQAAPLVNQSTGSADALTGLNACGPEATPCPGVDRGNPHALGRCGYGHAAALDRRLALGPGKLRRPFADRSDIRDKVHRR